MMASMLSSDGVNTLSELVESLAREWTANANACADVNGVFRALRGVVDSALTRVAMEWNSHHDVLRSVPPELLEPCFVRLPVVDKARLALVCSQWRTYIVNLPGIWTCLDLQRWKPSLDVPLAHSGRLPLDLTVRSGVDSMLWDRTLRAHAGRIKALELSVIAAESGTMPVLHYAFPILEELSVRKYRASMDEYTVSHTFLDQHAPRLRRLHLTDIALPRDCPAFARVTRLTIVGGLHTLEHLFEVMPLLEQLELKTFRNPPDLPPLPFDSRLHTVSLSNVPALSVENLIDLGYTKVPELALSRDDDFLHLTEAAAQFPGSQSTLRVSTDCRDIVLELRPDGRNLLRFAMQPRHNRVLQQLLCFHESAFHGIQTLTLPASLNILRFLVYPAVLLEPDAVVHLPALETLVLECAGRRSPEDSVPFAKFLAGTIRVPALARIRVAAAPNALEYCVRERVEVVHLVSLVKNTILCDGKSSIDIIVDTANGVLLEGDVEQLRCLVGSCNGTTSSCSQEPPEESARFPNVLLHASDIYSPSLSCI